MVDTATGKYYDQFASDLLRIFCQHIGGLDSLADYDRSEVLENFQKLIQRNRATRARAFRSDSNAIKEDATVHLTVTQKAQVAKPDKNTFVRAMNAKLNDTSIMNRAIREIDFLNVEAQKNKAELFKQLETLVYQGLAHVVTKSDRKWQIRDYANMVARSEINNEHHQYVEDISNQLGLDLVLCSEHVGARPLCAPYQGEVYSRAGNTGSFVDLRGRVISYRAFQSTSYGQAAGLLGINCRHHLLPISEEVYTARPRLALTKEENEKHYENQQTAARLARASRREYDQARALKWAKADKDQIALRTARYEEAKKRYTDWTKSKGLPVYAYSYT